MKAFYLNSVGFKICNFISLYRSPSQTADKFDSFLDDLKLNLDTITDNNPFLVVAIRDFNATSSSWCISDKVIIKNQNRLLSY